MSLVRKIPTKAKRSSRWRSQAHCSHIRSHECVACGCAERGQIEVAHVRLGSHTGLGQRPDDWRAVPLCKSCHRESASAQHNVGEASFWKALGKDPMAIIEELIKTSPKRRDIEEARRGASI